MASGRRGFYRPWHHWAFSTFLAGYSFYRDWNIVPFQGIRLGPLSKDWLQAQIPKAWIKAHIFRGES